MKDLPCDLVQDRLPGWASDSLEPEDAVQVEAHLVSCSECREASELVRMVRESRPPVPADLAEKITARVRQALGDDLRADRRASSVGRRNRFAMGPRWFPAAWALPAAAVVILALGTAVIWNNRDSDLLQDPLVVASQEPLPEAWLWDDGMIAGAPVFEGLSDEDLEALLAEYEG